MADKGGMFQFNPRKEIQTKEMLVCILVPNPRSMYCQQLSFASVAKTVMTLTFMSKRKQKHSEPERILASHLQNLSYLQEFDVKVQKDQCLL